MNIYDYLDSQDPRIKEIKFPKWNDFIVLNLKKFYLIYLKYGDCISRIVELEKIINEEWKLCDIWNSKRYDHIDNVNVLLTKLDSELKTLSNLRRASIEHANNVGTYIIRTVPNCQSYYNGLEDLVPYVSSISWYHRNRIK